MPLLDYICIHRSMKTMDSAPDHNKNKQEILWLSYINGNKEAFSELYKSFYKGLYSYGIGLGMKNEQVRDVIQELFLKLYSQPDLIKNTSTIQSFLFKSIRNAFINLEKDKQRYLDIKHIEDFEIKYSINENIIEDKEEREQIKLKIKNILDSLTPRQKEIIYLRFLHQMEYEEIAKIMSLSEQAARNLIHRALEKLRKDKNEYFILLIAITFWK